MSNLQLNCCLKFDFQKMDQHAGGKWFMMKVTSSTNIYIVIFLVYETSILLP